MSLLLTLNAGSSSIKFGLYTTAPEPIPEAHGQIDALGPDARLIVEQNGTRQDTEIGPADHGTGLNALIDALAPITKGRSIRAIGHRVVHGGPDIDGPRRLDAGLIAELRDLAPLAPLHQPHNLAGIEAAQKAFPDALQVAAFDTAFHRGHTRTQDTYALPRDWYDRGVRRYGFHGLSYDYIAGHLAQAHPDIAQRRLIVAHLGNGASLCALKDGRSVASTMGFSALEGLPMGTRTGRIDPGVLLYMLDHGLDAAAITDLLYRQSGLLGLSGLSHDMRTLLASDAPEAEEAVAHYCARLAQEIGGMTAVLGGLDGLVFTGGIGEHAGAIRARALANLGFLGLAVDPGRNARDATTIHAGDVPILVLPTDEEQVIARATAACLAEAGA